MRAGVAQSRFIDSGLFPTACVLCGGRAEAGRGLCEGCISDLPYHSAACNRCALPLEVEGVCGRCLKNPPPYERTFSVFHYVPPVDYLIQSLKYHGKLAIARLLGNFMIDGLARRFLEFPDVIVPVPLHPARLRERGYNQALELARPIARHFRIPLDYHCCERVRETSAQSGLPARERHKNVMGAFRGGQGGMARHVAVIDDVMTTGHTVAELAQTLRGCGVERIDVWICARASM